MRYESPANPAVVVDELVNVYSRAFAEPPYNEGDAETQQFRAIYTRHAVSSQVGVTVARDNAGAVAGFAYGIGQPPGWWWRHSDPPPREVNAAPLFALYEWAVVPAYRKIGVGRQLLSELMESRTEPWATLNVNAAANAYQIYRRTGWRSVGVCRPPGWPEMTIMTAPLPIRPQQDG